MTPRPVYETNAKLISIFGKMLYMAGDAKDF